MWPDGVARALTELRTTIDNGDNPLTKGQYHLTLCQIWQDITARLGPPDLVRSRAAAAPRRAAYRGRGRRARGAVAGAGVGVVTDPVSDWFNALRAPAHRRRPAGLLSARGWGAPWFCRWGELLPAEVDLVAVQYPGRLNRLGERCLTEMDEMTAGVCRALAEDGAGPVVLFGHSMGSLVAYEVARRLGADPERPGVCLIVSGRRHPGTRPGAAAPIHRRRALRRAHPARRDRPDGAAGRPAAPARADTARYDYHLVETYRHRARLPAVLLPGQPPAAERDPEASLDEMRDWARVTTGAFDLRVFPGDHFYLAPALDDVVAGVGDRLPVAAVWSDTARRRADMTSPPTSASTAFALRIWMACLATQELLTATWESGSASTTSWPLGGPGTVPGAGRPYRAWHAHLHAGCLEQQAVAGILRMPAAPASTRTGGRTSCPPRACRGADRLGRPASLASLAALPLGAVAAGPAVALLAASAAAPAYPTRPTARTGAGHGGANRALFTAHLLPAGSRPP